MYTDKLNNIVDTFIKENKLYMKSLILVEMLSNKLLDEEDIICKNNNYSKSIKLNESIKVIYDYLMTLDKDIANQFYNIIRMKNSRNELIVNFTKSTKETESSDYVSYNKMYLYYTNTFHDTFTILHEVFHKMNECYVEIDEQLFEVVSRDYLSELVSVTSEFKLANYMLEKGIINDNDLLLRKKYRQVDSKECAKQFLIENKLINLRLSGMEINYDNIFNPIEFEDNEKLMELLLNEKYVLLKLAQILDDEKLELPKLQRYVIAGALYEKILDDELFLSIHRSIGDREGNFNRVLKTLYKGLI